MILFHMDDGTHLIAEEAEEQPDPLRLSLGVACVVRYWGTTKGRGQLANDGPTEKTIIDPEPPGGRVNWLHIRRSIPVSESARKKWLKLISGSK